MSHRRESSIFTATSTPVQTRPPSVISDSGTDTLYIPKKKVSLEMSAPSTKVLALGKGTRVNRTSSISVSSSANKTAVRAGMDASSMGPPPLKTCPSIGTPTPSTTGLSLLRSSSTRRGVTTPSTFHRRVSSVTSERKAKNKAVNASPAPSVLEQAEKENVLQASTWYPLRVSHNWSYKRGYVLFFRYFFDLELLLFPSCSEWNSERSLACIYDPILIIYLCNSWYHFRF